MIQEKHKKTYKENCKIIKNFFNNSLLRTFSAADSEDVDTKNILYVTIMSKKLNSQKND